MGKSELPVCDFGMAEILHEINNNTATETVSSGDIVRYGAPELVDTNGASATEHSVTYSSAMLILGRNTGRGTSSHLRCESYTRESP